MKNHYETTHTAGNANPTEPFMVGYHLAPSTRPTAPFAAEIEDFTREGEVSIRSKILVGYDLALQRNARIKKEVTVSFKNCPMGIIFGGTGSGKTYAVICLLATIGCEMCDVEFAVADFKGEDFEFLRETRRYYSREKCGRGLDMTYKMLQDRQNGKDASRNPRFLIFDEFSGYILSRTKKGEADEAKAKLAYILMMGRSYNVHVLLIMQRPDATYFSAGARDQFSMVLAMGNLTREAATMFSIDRDELMPTRRPGEGHLILNGNKPIPICIPPMGKYERWLPHIMKRCGDLS